MVSQNTPFIINIILFTLMYLFFSKYKSEVYCVLFAEGGRFGVLFQLFQMLYISGQIWISYYNAIGL